MTDKRDMAKSCVRLRPDASVEPLAVDATFWQRLAAGELGTFHNEYLVSCHAFERDWAVWEMHPNGDEVVCLLAGAVQFVLQGEGGEETLALEEAGAYVIVPKGTWHTARVSRPSRMLFITAGEGTQHREAAAHG